MRVHPDSEKSRLPNTSFPALTAALLARLMVWCCRSLLHVFEDCGWSKVREGGECEGGEGEEEWSQVTPAAGADIPDDFFSPNDLARRPDRVLRDLRLLFTESSPEPLVPQA